MTSLRKNEYDFTIPWTTAPYNIYYKLRYILLRIYQFLKLVNTIKPETQF